MHVFFNELMLKNPVYLKVEHALPVDVTIELYDGTREQSQARKLNVDLYADSGNERWLCGEKIQLPEEFVRDIAVRLMRKRSLTSLPLSIGRPSSHYHEVHVPVKPTAKPEVTIIATKKKTGPQDVVTAISEEGAGSNKAGYLLSSFSFGSLEGY
jgi:hypothetical protein